VDFPATFDDRRVNDMRIRIARNFGWVLQYNFSFFDFK